MTGAATGVARRPIGVATSLAAAALVAAFAAIQLWTLDYGTAGNDARHVADTEIDAGALVSERSAMRRTIVAGAASADAESDERWLMRFKLYSVEADEHVNLIALARMDPSAMRFDPHFYQYGGAYLYPLGAWYFALGELGVVRLADLETLLREPDVVDGLYVFGRAFVLTAFILSAMCFYGLAVRLLPGRAAVLALGFYLFNPATLRFSELMKPHWYALIWVVPALWILWAWHAGSRATPATSTTLGVLLGLAVGSASTYGLFALLVGVALLAAWRRGTLAIGTVATVPMVAVATWFATNPFAFLNREAAAAEADLARQWFDPTLSWSTLVDFFTNSYLPGFSVFGALAVLVAIREAASPSHRSTRWIGAALLTALLVVAILTASKSAWSTNVRYLPWLLPIAALLTVGTLHRRWYPLLGLALLASIAHSVPIKLAYADENDPERSTRLRAAAWIDTHVPAGAGVCAPDPRRAPYNVPPFDFTRVSAPSDASECEWLVLSSSQIAAVGDPGPGWVEAARFESRLASVTPFYPASHVNPPVRIHSKIAAR